MPFRFVEEQGMPSTAELFPLQFGAVNGVTWSPAAATRKDHISADYDGHAPKEADAMENDGLYYMWCARCLNMCKCTADWRPRPPRDIELAMKVDRSRQSQCVACGKDTPTRLGTVAEYDTQLKQRFAAGASPRTVRLVARSTATAGDVEVGIVAQARVVARAQAASYFQFQRSKAQPHILLTPPC